MNITENFDTFVESVVSKYESGEISLEDMRAVLELGYDDCETMLVKELATLVDEDVISMSEATDILDHMDSGYPEEYLSMNDLLESSYQNITEAKAYNVNNKVVKGQMTDAERAAALKELEKKQKRANFRKKLGTVGKAALLAGAAYGGYKLAGSDLAAEGKNRVANAIDKKKEQKFNETILANRRRENSQYRDLYSKYDDEDKEIAKAQKKELKGAKTDYEKKVIYNRQNVENAERRRKRGEELDNRTDSLFGYGPERRQVEVRDSQGRVDKKATKRAQREADAAYRNARSQYRQSALDGDDSNVGERYKRNQYRQIDKEREAKRKEALLPLHQRVGKKIGRGIDAAARGIDKVVAADKERRVRKVDRQFDNAYDIVDNI